MKHKLLLTTYLLFAIASVLLFNDMAINPITFTQLTQNPEKTMQKYKNVWDDTTIVTKSKTDAEFVLGEKVGTITIPKMKYYERPIYYGSNNLNNNWQISTPGYLGNWGMFGDKRSAALGAHNYQLFSQLPTMEKGDLFIIETDIDTYVFEVTGMCVYNHTKDDWNKTAFADSAPYSTTLMTCYPVDAVVTKDMYLVYSKMKKGTKFE
ncbi:MAG: sortase [Oscillospiraceae bacterium]